MMQTERRSAPRQGLNSLLYLDLEPDNGGILLNLSETGMQISVARRLVTSTEVRFSLCLKPKEKICGTGRIAWLSPSGRSAGVHFLDMPESARREIRRWMGQAADCLSSEDRQTVHARSHEAPQTDHAAAVPEPAPAPDEPQSETTQVSPTPFSPVVEPAPQLDARASILEQTKEIAAPHAQATEPEPAPPPPLTVASEASQPPQPALEQPAAVETHQAAILATEASAPVPLDPLELLVSTVEPQPLESAPNPWAQCPLPPVETPLTGSADPQPSVLALYGIDGREKEAIARPATAPPPQLLEQTRVRTPSIADVQRMKGRAEVRRRAKTAARSPIQPSPETGPKPVILDGITDVAAPPRPSAPAATEAAMRARAIRLTSPIFIPAPPQFQLPPPEFPPVEFRAPAAPVFDPPPPRQPLPEPRPVQSSIESVNTSLPETHTSEAACAPGALYLPNYRMNGVTPDGTWRASRLFMSPLMAIPEIFERFEAFGWSLESDWHVWVALIFLVAGFLALAQNPPLIVLTVAFWFASAVVVLERRGPRQNSARSRKSGPR
jgi:hypothetical protein